MSYPTANPSNQQGRIRVAVEMYEDAAAFGNPQRKFFLEARIGMMKPKLEEETCDEKDDVNLTHFDD